MKIVEIADEIYRDIDDDTNVDIPKIAFWLRSNIGKLITLLHICIEINSTTLEFEPELNDEEKDILKELYFIRYYKKKANEHLGASGHTWVEIREGDTMIRRTAKTELAKVYLQLQSDSKSRLDALVDLYRRNRSNARSVDIKDC